ncbi:MAG: MFS transporter [Alphaproteobacteria bacterium]|nr:MAG: MFS transporter [Alphaproteobacteria bacterium]
MTSRLATGALALGQTLVWAGLYYIFPALLVRWEDDFGWGRAETALGMTVALIVSALAAPLAGRIIDRGRAPVLMAGAALLGGAALVLLTRIESLWQFHAIWAVIGLAMAGCLYEPCFAAITRAGPARARRRITAVTLVAGFASTLAFPAASLLADGPGWRAAALAAAAAVALLGAPLLWFGLRALGDPPAPAPDAPPARSTGKVLRRPEFWLLAAGFALIGLNHWMLIAHLLPLLGERGTDPGAALLAISLIGPMQVTGRVVLVLIGEARISARSATRFAFAGLTLASLSLLAVPALGGAGVLALGLFVVLQGACVGLNSILRPVLTAELFGPGAFGAVSGTIALPYIAASALAPFLGALVWNASGYTAMLWTTAFTAFAALVMVSLIRRPVLPQEKVQAGMRAN